MQLRAKIKSITVQPTRGTRILPSQILLSDSNKSISISQQPKVSFNKQNNILLSNEVLLPDSSRVNNRHTVQVINYRPSVSRLSLDNLNKNNVDSSKEGNMSDRSINRQLHGNNEYSIISNRQKADKNDKQQQNLFNAFKNIQFQRVNSTQTRTQDISPSRFEPNSQMSILKNSQIFTSQPNNFKLEQTISNSYKHKYELLEKDYRNLIQKFKDHQLSQEMQAGKRSNQVRKIEELEQKIAKLQQALKTNRNINEALMKNEREFQKRLKRCQQNHQAAKASILQAQKQKRQGLIINMQKQIFELKLKLIDQQNRFQQTIKLKQIQSKYQLSELQQSMNHYYKGDLQAKTVELSQAYQQLNNLRILLGQANNQAMRMSQQIVRVDQQNVRLDELNTKLSNENQQLAQLNRQLVQQNHSLFVQKSFNQKQLIEANNKLKQYAAKHTVLQGEKQLLAETLQDKQSLISQLNIAKNNALLSILELQNKLKHQKTHKQHFEQQKMMEIQTQFEQRIKKLQQVIISKDNELNKLGNYIQQLKLEIERSKQSKGQQIKQIQALNEDETSKLHTQIQQIKVTHQQSINKMELQKDKLLQQIKEYQSIQLQRDHDLKKRQSQISQRANQLKEVEQQYLDLIQGQLKKIQSYQLQQPQLPDIASSPHSRSLSLQHSPNKHSRRSSKSSLGKDHQQQSMLELHMKIEQLTFVNEALRKKVEQLTQLQQNSNIFIIQKIKQFESNLQRSLHEKMEADQHNIALQQRLREINQRCIQYECRIEWLENTYKQLQHNLIQTQQQLLISQLQYMNIKMAKYDDDIEEVEQQLIKDNVQSQPIPNPLQKEDNYSQCQQIIQIIKDEIQNQILQSEGQVHIRENEEQIHLNYAINSIYQEQDDIPKVNVIFVDSQESQDYDQYPYINIIEVSSNDYQEKAPIQDQNVIQMHQQIFLEEPLTQGHTNVDQQIRLEQKQEENIFAFIQTVCQLAEQFNPIQQGEEIPTANHKEYNSLDDLQ